MFDASTRLAGDLRSPCIGNPAEARIFDPPVNGCVH
jgi:hypothetical protein